MKENCNIKEKVENELQGKNSTEVIYIHEISRIL